MNETNKNDRKDNSSHGPVLGMCIGIALGAAVGAATHNFGTWLPVGLCLGLALGYSMKDNGNDTNDKQQKK